MLSVDDLKAIARQADLATPSIALRRVVPAPGRERADAPGGLLDLALDADRALYPASMIKTPLAAALATLWAGGVLRPDSRALVTEQNMTANDKSSPLQPGYGATLEEAATLMLTRSDNVATNVLIDVVGRERATEIAHAMGLAATAVHRKVSGSLPLVADPEATGRNAHPAQDAALLFEMIARGAVPGARWLYATLLAQEWNEKLSRGLRRGDRFAHKTGDTDEVAHDGGILDTAGGACYVIAVYTSHESSPAADARFAEFMTLLRPFL